MRFQTEAWDQYSEAQNQAKRTVRKCAATGATVNPPILKSVLSQDQVAGELELGVVNIPVNQIVGVVSDNDRELYASDFLPLPSILSEFAVEWTQQYMAHLSDSDLAEPIRCYEYLGFFYVIDGKKRVSAAKAYGALTMKANVTRLMPIMTDDSQIRSYYEFVKAYDKTGLYQIFFSQEGKTEPFLKALGYEPDHIWNEADRFAFMFHWYPFERALQLAFDDSLNVTTADALMVLLEDHTYEELRKLPIWSLAELMQESWEDILRVSDPDFRNKKQAS